MPFLDVVLALIVLWVIMLLMRTYVPLGDIFKSIVTVVLGLMLVGVGLWVINTYIPMAGVIKAILNIVVVVATCVWVLQVFGLWTDVVRLWGTFRYRTAEKGSRQ